MGAGGQNKGAGGTPMQGQGKGAGGNAMSQGASALGALGGGPQGAMDQQYQQYKAQAGAGAQLPNMQQMQADQMRMRDQAMQMRGGPQAGIAGLGQRFAPGSQAAMADQMKQRQIAAMQQKNFMSGTGNYAGMNGSDFMPGGALGAANTLTGAGAEPPIPPTPVEGAAAAAAGAKPAPGADALARMQSSMQAQQQRSPGNNLMPDGTPGGPRIGQYMQQGFNRGKGGGGNAKGGGGNPMAQGPMAQPMSQQGRMDQAYGDFQKQMDFRTNALSALGGRGFANGGIVGLADGGRLGAVSGGGVTYGPPSAAPPAMAVRPAVPVAAAPVAAAPVVAAAPAWTPQAVTTGGGMFSGIASVPIAQPAKWSGPTTPQKLWEPPKAVVPTGPAGLQGADMGKAVLFGASKEMLAQMTPRQYTDYMVFRQQAGGSGGGGGGGRGSRGQGDRGGYQS